MTSSTSPNPARSTSPPNSFYAVSDSDDSGAYNTIKSTVTGRGVKLLFSKSKAGFCSLRLRARSLTYSRSTSTPHPQRKITSLATSPFCNRNPLQTRNPLLPRPKSQKFERQHPCFSHGCQNPPLENTSTCMSRLISVREMGLRDNHTSSHRLLQLRSILVLLVHIRLLSRSPPYIP